MSKEEDKIKHSKRLLKDENAIKKQSKIAKEHGSTHSDQVVKQPHRLSKHRAMDCGNPQCGLCGNPRHIHKDGLKIQEKSFVQTGAWQNDDLPD
jgi:hypothetical protein